LFEGQCVLLVRSQLRPDYRCALASLPRDR
jgi:hypothetical protein